MFLFIIAIPLFDNSFDIFKTFFCVGRFFTFTLHRPDPYPSESAIIQALIIGSGEQACGLLTQHIDRVALTFG